MNIIVALAAIWGLISLLSLAGLVVMCLLAPEGWEDEEGWHYGRNPKDFCITRQAANGEPNNIPNIAQPRETGEYIPKRTNLRHSEYIGKGK